MLDNLLDIEVAYSLLRGGVEDNKKDPIDLNYEKLKTKIEVKFLFKWVFLRWYHDIIMPVVFDADFVFIGGRQVIKWGSAYPTICEEHTRCYSQHLHTGSWGGEINAKNPTFNPTKFRRPLNFAENPFFYTIYYMPSVVRLIVYTFYQVKHL